MFFKKKSLLDIRLKKNLHYGDKANLDEKNLANLLYLQFIFRYETFNFVLLTVNALSWHLHCT